MPAVGPLTAAAAVVVAWQLLAQAGVLPVWLVSPAAVVEQLGVLAASGELARHAGASLYRSAVGLALGAGTGVALGLAAGVSRPVAAFFDPLVALTYPVPKVAILPVLIVWFGISDLSKIMVIAISCFYPCFIAALYGARGTDPTWVWAARSMGARPARTFLRVVLPSAAPQIFSGLRVALALSFILMLAAEMIGSSNRTGLGFLILAADASGRFDLMFAAIAAIAGLGFCADRALLRLRRALAPAPPAVEATFGE
ncbi:MAG: ABC transporter permease [Armatimonadota bacterium]|nr:ABC transporter permease [Armatimonadota bacterium]MDR7423388.1 ABC transporter permease [Armatimonadota bacterium]MDR7454558.1 ABC transporter permease [Armatimonadota bacterium]MDR7457115.1 ABC transporter permease [Armatimonadota bacterium]MDR7496591.1 ABC transporter permease [Armatimonadota bacterium]